MSHDRIHDAIIEFAQELAALITASVEREVVIALGGDHQRIPSTPAPSPARSVQWPITGTNCHHVLEAVRARSDGMTVAEIMSAVGINRRAFGKAIDKLKARGSVRRVGSRGRRGFRYFATS